MARPARRKQRTALAVSAAAAIAAAGNSCQHSAVEAFQPPAASLPQHLLVASDAPPLSRSSPPHHLSRSHADSRRGSSAASPLSPLAVSASASQGDSSENSPPADLQNLAESAFSTLSSAADQVQQNANDWTDAYVDEYELEQEELSRRRAGAAAEAAERRRQYEVTVPLTTASTNSYSQPDAMAAAMAGMTLRQISPGGQISAQALDLDSASLLPNLTTEEELDPTLRDGAGGSVEILPALLQMEGGGSMVGDTATTTSSRSRGGKGGSRVVVSSVVRDGAAWASGVRPGDVVLATSATVGQVRTCHVFYTTAVNK